MSDGVGMMDKGTTFPSRYEREEKDIEMSDARITAQLSHMGEQLEKAHAMLSELESVLEPILLPAREYNDGHPVDGAPTSDLSRLIDTYNYSLSELQRRLMQTRKRVQL